MGNQWKILVTERIAEEGIEMLKQEADVHVDFELSSDEKRPELLKEIKNYDAIIVRSKTKIDRELFDASENLKVVGRAGNGIDNIEVKEATKRGVVVANTPDSNTISAAELAIGLLIAQSRNISQANTYIKSGKWERNKFKGSELYGKVLGIVGLGRIGSLVATRMQSFGMKVIGYDPYIQDERFKRFNVEKKDALDKLIKESDFISVHTPRTEETMGMIGEDEIEIMKEGVRLVNAARGGIISEQAILKGIKNGKIASAGIDVHEVEPCYDNPLYEYDNVIVTPHIGASTLEAQQNVGVTIANQVISALKGEVVTNAVNLPTLNRDELITTKPYIDLMDKLGGIYYQLYNDPVEKVEISYYGNVARQETDMATIAFLKGLLSPVVGEHVNYVNAKMLAEQRGIALKENKKMDVFNGYTQLITVKVRGKNKTFTISGNLSSKNEGKIVEIEGYEVDVEPSEFMIFVQNIDVPGVIGKIGTTLAIENVNIAKMQVGRNKPGERALMLLNVDDIVSKDTLDALTKVENVIWAKAVRL
ncbi:phosphoglycerate dehydrogenase [Clostridiisalibacter paucivorans]|uniref:phosphoglycerate dehydrogenase n=1 Tax=Clostridiisalibacter paucivorans TaxID=408753 RepID=UPI00047933E4|nr:phosphoglycerate dehydrogenase [Clostridiisalibacter paucivorans]